MSLEEVREIKIKLLQDTLEKVEEGRNLCKVKPHLCHTIIKNLEDLVEIALEICEIDI